MEKARLLQETRRLRDHLRDRNAFRHVVSGDPRMESILELVSQVGPSKASVLITGESGTGKELIAEALCAASPRAQKPFVRLHCAALAESLLESELFGHEKGAFTGAIARREGRFKQADGGTLFLDEVGEIPLGTQVKLLRVLQERTFERVGGNETVKVDVRVIAATHSDLKADIKKGTFREDLYYRLNVVAIELPPLRERKGDVLPLASFFLGRYAMENGKTIDGFSEGARAALTAYDWPGNVRELENVIERAAVLSDSREIEVRNLPPALVPERERQGPPPIPGSTIAELEKYAILKTLEECAGSTSKAAMVLGISTRKIQYKLHEYGEPIPTADPADLDKEEGDQK
jgi:DNA-binding NtrC family response regulator